MTDPTVKRLALIGAGSIAADHAAAIAATAGLCLVRVVDRHADRAHALAARYGAHHSTTPADLWADDVDAVVVCTSPDSHVELSVQALTKGKAVLCEKPVALSLPSLDTLLRTARDTAGPLLIGQTARFQPTNMDILRVAESGEIGEPRLVHISWLTGHVWPGGWRGWQMNTSRSGGHVVHNGVHALDLACAVLNDQPIRVCARPLHTWASRMPTPDSFHIAVEFERGALAVVELSYGLRRPGAMHRRILVAGTGGSACVSSDDEPASDTHPPAASAGVDGAMVNQYRHFRDVLIGRTAPATSPSQIRGALAAALAAQRGVDSGEPTQEVES